MDSRPAAADPGVAITFERGGPLPGTVPPTAETDSPDRSWTLLADVISESVRNRGPGAAHTQLDRFLQESSAPGALPLAWPCRPSTEPTGPGRDHPQAQPRHRADR